MRGSTWNRDRDPNTGKPLSRKKKLEKDNKASDERVKKKKSGTTNLATDYKKQMGQFHPEGGKRNPFKPSLTPRVHGGRPSPVPQFAPGTNPTFRRGDPAPARRGSAPAPSRGKSPGYNPSLGPTQGKPYGRRAVSNGDFQGEQVSEPMRKTQQYLKQMGPGFKRKKK